MKASPRWSSDFDLELNAEIYKYTCTARQTTKRCFISAWLNPFSDRFIMLGFTFEHDISNYKVSKDLRRMGIICHCLLEL